MQVSARDKNHPQLPKIADHALQVVVVPSVRRRTSQNSRIAEGDVKDPLPSATCFPTLAEPSGEQGGGVRRSSRRKGNCSHCGNKAGESVSPEAGHTGSDRRKSGRPERSRHAEDAGRDRCLPLCHCDTFTKRHGPARARRRSRRRKDDWIAGQDLPAMCESRPVFSFLTERGSVAPSQRPGRATDPYGWRPTDTAKKRGGMFALRT